MTLPDFLCPSRVLYAQPSLLRCRELPSVPFTVITFSSVRSLCCGGKLIEGESKSFQVQLNCTFNNIKHTLMKFRQGQLKILTTQNV